MSLNQIISLEKHAYLNIDNQRLKLTCDEEEHFFSLKDIAVLCLDNSKITISKSVLQECGKANVCVLVTDEKHMPSMMSIPYSHNKQIAKRSFQQAYVWNSQFLGECWRQVLVSKLYSQAINIKDLHSINANKILAYATEVLPGDPGMVEAKAARIYWDTLFSSNFKRHKLGAVDVTNIRLNYGYAIVRAAMARTIASYGLQPTLGIGHCRKDNPFNLVEDMMEPFRFLVEKCVLGLDPKTKFSAKDRAVLLNILSENIVISGKRYRVFSAMDIVIQSFCNCIEHPRLKILLSLPHVSNSKNKYTTNINVMKKHE